MEKRGGVLFDIDGDVLEKRMRAYLDHRLDWGKYRVLGYRLTEPQSNFDPESARDSIRNNTVFQQSDIRPYAFKPFDNRHCYYSPTTSLWNDPRPELARQCRRGNHFLITRPAAAVDSEGTPFFLTGALSVPWNT